MSDFQFTDEQFTEIREVWRDINFQCQIIKDQTGCPNSEIVKMIDSAKSYWEQRSSSSVTKKGNDNRNASP